MSLLILLSLRRKPQRASLSSLLIWLCIARWNCQTSRADDARTGSLESVEYQEPIEYQEPANMTATGYEQYDPAQLDPAQRDSAAVKQQQFEVSPFEESARGWLTANDHRDSIEFGFLPLVTNYRNSLVATRVNSSGVPTGQTESLELDLWSALRVRTRKQLLPDLDFVSSLMTYAGKDDRYLNANPGGAFFGHRYRSEVSPGTSATVDAESKLHFATLDFGFEQYYVREPQWDISGIVGVRLALMSQDFDSYFSNSLSARTVSEMDSMGFGLRMGLKAQSTFGTGFFGYAEGYGNALIRQMSGVYSFGADTYNSLLLAMLRERDIEWQMDFEFGLGWRSGRDRCRVKVGYFLTNWFNVIQINDAIRGYFAGNGFRAAESSVLFHGMNISAEYRF